MLTVKIQCDIPMDRVVTVKLPDQVAPGRHELLLVVDDAAQEKVVAENLLNNLAGSVPRFAELDGVAVQRAARDEWP